MTDPLGLIRGTGGVGPGVGTGPIGPGAGRPVQGPAFKDVLLENLNEVNRAQQEATRAVEDLKTGKRTDLEGVILATQKADNAFRMLQSLRNRMMEAFDEIKQFRV